MIERTTATNRADAWGLAEKNFSNLSALIPADEILFELSSYFHHK